MWKYTYPIIIMKICILMMFLPLINLIIIQCELFIKFYALESMLYFVASLKPDIYDVKIYFRY